MQAGEVVQTMIEAGVPPCQRAYSLLAYAWSKSWRWESNLRPVNLNSGNLKWASNPRPVDRDRVDSNRVESVPEGMIISDGYQSYISDTDTGVNVFTDVEVEVEFSDVIQSSQLTSQGYEIQENSSATILNYPITSNQGTVGSLLGDEREVKSGDVAGSSRKQRQELTYYQKGEYVRRTEEVIFDCLAAGIQPDVSLRRSLLYVWCRHGQADRNDQNVNIDVNIDNKIDKKNAESSDDTDYKNTNHNEKSKTNNKLDYSQNQNCENGDSRRSKIQDLSSQINSIKKAEDLLARISIIGVIKSVEKYQGEKVTNIQNNISLASLILSLDCEENSGTLLPHPSVYMQLANAWNKEGENSDNSNNGDGSYFNKRNHAVLQAERFLVRVCADIDALKLHPHGTHTAHTVDDHDIVGRESSIGSEGEREGERQVKGKREMMTKKEKEKERKEVRKEGEGEKEGEEEGEKEDEDERESNQFVSVSPSPSLLRNKSEVEISTDRINKANVKEVEKEEEKEVEKEVEEEAFKIHPRIFSEGLYIAYNLLLAAHALACSDTSSCETAEV